MKLIRRTEIEKPETVYTLGVQDDHNYIVEGAVVENCHRVKGNVLQKLLSKHLNDVPIRWGVTGTLPPSEMSKMSLLVFVGPTIDTIKTSLLQEKGFLSKLSIHVMQLVETGMVPTKSYKDEVTWLISDQQRLNYIASVLDEIRKSGNTMVLVDRVTTGKILNSLIKDSVFVSGTTKSKARLDEYKRAQTEDNLLLIATSGVASTGININRLFNLVLFESGKSFVKVIQSIGRGLRVAEDKDFVKVYDICSTCKYSSKHLAERKKLYKQAGYPFSIEKMKY